MNRQQRRAQQRSPLQRPTIINEQLREQINANMGRGRRVMNRDECAQFVVMLATQLERMLNDDERLPWVTSTIDKRANGFSIHVDVMEPTIRTDLIQ